MLLHILLVTSCDMVVKVYISRLSGNKEVCRHVASMLYSPGKEVVGKMRNCGMRNAESKMRNSIVWKQLRNGG